MLKNDSHLRPNLRENMCVCVCVRKMFAVEDMADEKDDFSFFPRPLMKNFIFK